MAKLARLISPRSADPPGMRLAARARVIYGDTDRMGVVYHGTYLRFLEQGRVELMRGLGVRYVDIEARGFGFPVTDVAVSYFSPARYDDVLSIHVAVTEMRWARLSFAYHLTVEPGDRDGVRERVSVLRGETRHCCTALATGQPTRFPGDVHERLAALLELPS
ncbi:MAG: acyl-CoA thioesterase [Myxococcales bacterium]|nr:acyl-CoA thioesterase [Myxococcales bacterium]MCB9750109.1 acyl-CoA thioesterase [Myxococcales bacterium]